MPIKNLTDRGPAFPRIGELRKGGEKTSANKPGPDLKYFRFTSKDAEVVADFVTQYGDKPTSINCYLPFQTADENFDSWIEEWSAGGLKWRGDGENLVIWQKPDGTYSREPKPQPETGGKEIGRLKIIIPELKRLAYVTALTSAINDIMNMSGWLQAYEAMRGDLRGIPFVLSRVPVMVSTPSGQNGGRARREKWLWHLEAQPMWVKAQLSVMQRAALPSGVDMLDDGNVIDIETGEIFDDDDAIEGEVTANPNGQQIVMGSDNTDAIDESDQDEDLESAIITCRSWLEDKIKDNLVELGFVMDAAAMTPLFKTWKDVHNALAGENGYPFPDGFKVNKKQNVKGDGALKVYDWLTSSKVETAES